MSRLRKAYSLTGPDRGWDVCDLALAAASVSLFRFGSRFCRTRFRYLDNCVASLEKMAILALYSDSINSLDSNRAFWERFCARAQSPVWLASRDCVK